MKVKTEEDQAFKPVVLTITVESTDELSALWHRFNVGMKWLHKRYSVNAANAVVSFPSGEDWNEWDDLTEEALAVIDRLAIRHGLRTGGKVGRH